MTRLDSVEKANKEETIQLTEDISVLKKVNQELQEENQLLRNDKYTNTFFGDKLTLITYPFMENGMSGINFHNSPTA